MNWYKQLVAFIKVANEWWITGSGQSMYADGDVGDWTHEGHVIDTILSQYDLSQDSGVNVEDPEFVIDFTRDHWNEIRNHWEQTGEWEDGWDQLYTTDPEKAVQTVGYTISLRDIIMVLGGTEEEAEVASGRGDARLFARKVWGWKSVRGTEVETWTLTPKDMQVISSGLWDAYQESDENNVYNIYVDTQQSWYRDVPSSVLESGNAAEMIQYNAMRQNKMISPEIIPKSKQFTMVNYEGD